MTEYKGKGWQYEYQYLRLLRDILSNGNETKDRTGTGTLSLFGAQIVHDLQQGFPLLTTKKVFWKGVVEELLWMLRGETNIKYLQEKGITIWDEWANEYGDLGPIYGAQWRNSISYIGFNIDQIKILIDGLKNNPTSRRHIVSAWNVADLNEMALPPCHCFFQCHVRGEYLDLQLYQRSADMFLGVPFNVASYSLITHLITSCVGLKPGRFIHTFGDAHIYLNHINAVETQLQRSVLPPANIKLNASYNYPWEFKYEDIELRDYVSHASIPGKVSV